jgi:Fe-S cluster assembly ATPase SufC
MSNFKGTRGKWKLAENEYGYYTSVRNLDDSIKVCTSRVNNQNESNANLLLISKAPEMLEFIINVFNTMPNGSVIQEKAKQLIKEATELC